MFERLQDQSWAWILQGFVCAHEVRVRQPFEELAFPEQSTAPCGITGAVRAWNLGDAEAQALRANMDFLADSSHELRTPLTVVNTNAEVGAHLEDNPSQREIFEEILKESTQMSRMVEDLLFLARSDSDSLPLEMKILPVPTFMAEVAGRAEVLTRERGSSFAADLRGDGELRADPTRLEQAILVLVDNAAKYNSAGQPVTLLSTSGLHGLVIRVEDRGPGIPEEDLSRIFERFYRVDKVRERKVGGAGLGRSIAKTIIEVHGGRIEAENRSGGGARISIRLPLASSSEYTHDPPPQ